MFLVMLKATGILAQRMVVPDTLLVQRFEVDPTDTILPFPLGNDMQWVNWDADLIPPLCDDGKVPGNWFWDSDLGDSTNYAYTSCSYLLTPNKPNQNWLITPPIFISDTQAVLSWRSLSFEGPAYLDGYKVLLSTTSNAPYEGAFTDTLFVAAEMIDFIVPFSLDPNDYIFSAGYVHANWFRDSAYFLPADTSYPNNRGLMEPHEVSLAPYAGKQIYIAFLHDSQDDNILQIDDIVVVQGVGLRTTNLFGQGLKLMAFPSPGRSMVRLQSTEVLRPVAIRVTDAIGRLMVEQPLHGQPTDSVVLDVSALPPGLYWVRLLADRDVQPLRLVRQ